MNLIKWQYFLLCYFALISSVFAAIPENGFKGQPFYKDAGLTANKTPGHFEILGGPGVGELDATNSTLGVTSSETDELVQTNSGSWTTLAGQLGAGYIYYFGDAQPYSNQIQWLPSVEPELNSYYLSSNSIKGNVLSFGSPALSNLTFDIPVHSVRLMLDGALTVASWKQYSVYGIAGIGRAWTRINYSDSPNSGSPCPDQGLSLSSHTSSNFAWEVGAGLTYAYNDRYGVSIEYLYAGLGPVQTGASGNFGGITTPLIVPAQFNLSSQAALIALHIAI